jgi:hypothetical protein
LGKLGRTVKSDGLLDEVKRNNSGQARVLLEDNALATSLTADCDISIWNVASDQADQGGPLNALGALD